MTPKNKTFLLLGFIFFLALVFRFWHNDFGLPHSFYADEPEIVEPAIKYTYEIRDIVANNNWYKMIPISYVYGTFPTYLLTIFFMTFSKLLGIFGVNFPKESLYILARTLTGLISFSIIPIVSYLYYKMFKDKFGAMVCLVLLGFNWKLIAHAHYVNQDITITALLAASFLTFYLYSQKKFDHFLTILTGILVGLAVGTKITVLMMIPLYWYVFHKKKDYVGFVAFLFVIFGTFMVTNPFSMIFIQDFVFRVYQMLFKEGGMVFDSVNYSPTKYLEALGFISTVPVILISLYGKLVSFKSSKEKTFHVFLIGQVILYLLFFTLQSRRVDRWLLPVLPLVIFYASFGISKLRQKLSKFLFFSLTSLSFVYYLFFAVMLLFQFQRFTPKSNAYVWAQQNLPPTATKLSYTEEGLDPLNKLPFSKVVQFNVYVSKAAWLDYPLNPLLYDYVILSSRVLENYKKEEVIKAYPNYAEAWLNFEKMVKDPKKFKLVKKFELPEPNLIPLSDVFVYQKIK